MNESSSKPPPVRAVIAHEVRVCFTLPIVSYLTLALWQIIQQLNEGAAAAAHDMTLGAHAISVLRLPDASLHSR